MKKKVGFFSAAVLFFKNYVNFMDNSTRREYWFVMLWQWLLTLLLYVWIMFAAFGAISNGAKLAAAVATLKGPIIVAGIFSVVTLVPMISLHVRRYRDAGISPLWLILTLIGPAVLIAVGSMTDVTWPLILAGAIGIVNFVLAARPSRGLRF
ncbi:DUF805 domain-containing protein [Lacticaseibacillus hulanensis]|uniref:DUF805 domain-containing protein n=1 Tax=Lacticaseibacillus hulanensis TaxID=2493111 RepID=UPI0013E32DB3|nr:DUF805 domain-containing protein [Lacticaseibacillus hulanensis]